MPSITHTHTHVRYSRARRCGNTTQTQEDQQCRVKFGAMVSSPTPPTYAPSICALAFDHAPRAFPMADRFRPRQGVPRGESAPITRSTTSALFRQHQFAFCTERVRSASTRRLRDTSHAHAHPIAANVCLSRASCETQRRQPQDHRCDRLKHHE